MDGFSKKIIIIFPFLSSLLPYILFLSFQNSYSQELQREYRVYDSESDEYESTINKNEEEEEL